MDLALGCDIRVMADNAKLAAAFTARGVLPESGGTWILPRLLGWSKAAEIIFTQGVTEICLILSGVIRNRLAVSGIVLVFNISSKSGHPGAGVVSFHKYLVAWAYDTKSKRFCKRFVKMFLTLAKWFGILLVNAV